MDSKVVVLVYVLFGAVLVPLLNFFGLSFIPGGPIGISIGAVLGLLCAVVLISHIRKHPV